jgi:hypothetical protein
VTGGPCSAAWAARASQAMPATRIKAISLRTRDPTEIA